MCAGECITQFVCITKSYEVMMTSSIIHRDLAARNCLMGTSDIVKIAKFGMTREAEGRVYKLPSGTTKTPTKWTAPEVCICECLK